MKNLQRTGSYLLVALTALILTACDNPERTVDQLRTELATFRATPNDQTQAAVEASFSKLDAQITRLEKAGKNDQAAALRDQETSLRAEYAAAKISRAVHDTKNAVEGIGNAIIDAGRSIGDAFRAPDATPTPAQD